MRRLLLIAIILTFNFRLVGQVEISPIPEWVIDVDMGNKPSTFSKYEILQGFYTSCYDYQLNFINNADFTRIKLDVVTGSGVATASQIYVSYDTSYQTLDFHYLYVWRNGIKIDKTDELNFEILKNEQNLGSGIYTGLITAYQILEDIRRGDQIEYAYTITGNNPIFNNQQFRLFPLEDLNPIDFFNLRIVHEKGKKYQTECKGCENVNILNSTTNDYEEIIVTSQDIAAGDFEKTTPSWHVNYDYYSISSTDSWEEVNDWAVNIFRLEESPDFTKFFNEIGAGKSKRESINHIIDYVQDDIRYMGIESGIGSIKPYHPNKVLKQRFGDCKDKSLLLVELLKHIGINEAYPVLVNTSMQSAINTLIPSGYLFDHCIVYFKYENVGYWVDPTISLQGGDFEKLSNADYGHALIVKTGSSELKKMDINSENSKSRVKEEIEIVDFDTPGTMRIVTNAYGMNADYLRNVLDYYSLKELSEQTKLSYGRIYPNIRELEKMKIIDDEEKNVITLIEHYEIDNLWQEEESQYLRKKIFQYEPLTLYEYLTILTCEEKKFPVQLAYPSNVTQTTIIQLPEAINIKSDTEEIENESFSFSKKTKSIGKAGVRLDYQFRALDKEISAKNFMERCNELNEILNGLPLQIFYSEFKKK